MKTSFHKVLRCAIAILLLAVPAWSWEADTHYGLTKWLGVRAGFTLQEAETIALGTLEPDEGSLYPAPSAVISYACKGRDMLASRFVQENHFPSYGPIPSVASKRTVVPGLTDNAANLWVRKEIAAVVGGVSAGWALRTFGNSLHPLEDSWAHQGEPDMPWLCSKQLAWGHPDNRGGWRRHDADLTYLHEADTLATAKKTYELMLAYRQARGLSVSAAPAWTSIEPAVKAFANAKTIEEKKKWFNSDPGVPFSSYTKKGFLDDINIPKKEKTFHLFSSVSQPQGNFVLASQRVSSRQMCVQDFVMEFLILWIEKRDFRGARQFMDTEAVAASLRGKEVSAQLSNIEAATVVETMLASWLVADHGAVNLFGHGQLVPGFLNLRRAQVDAENFPLIPYGPVAEALRTPGAAWPFTVSRLPLPTDARKGVSEVYGVMLQFAHTPADTIELIVEKRTDGWVVAEFEWVAM